MGEFKPVRVEIRDSAGEVAIVAADVSGGARGIVLPNAIRPVLEEFLPTSGPRFLALWKSYGEDRGGDSFFSDLAMLARAIVRAPDLPVIRKLSGFRASTEVLHGAVQALLMAEAHSLFPGCVRLDVAGGNKKRGDFVVETNDVLSRFEVKTITGMCGIELHDEGVKICHEDALSLKQSVQAKVDEGHAQVGDNGTVVVAAWCNVAGAILARRLKEWECQVADVFRPAQVVLGIRDEDGRNRWYAFGSQSWPTLGPVVLRRIDELHPGSDPIPIPFLPPGGEVSMCRGSGWSAVGRPVKIANLRTTVGPTGAGHGP